MTEPKFGKDLPIGSAPKEDLRIRQQEFQIVLDNPNFQQAVTAHRIFDMNRHSTNLYQRFPDFSPPSGVLEELGSASGTFVLDNGQIESLGEAMQEGRNHVRSAWLFAAGEDAFGLIHIAAGHAIRNVPHPNEKQELRAEQRRNPEGGPPRVPRPDSGRSLRGVFIRLGGEYEGDYVMQLDAGGSRDLYDHGDKDFIFRQIIPQMHKGILRDDWIDKFKRKANSLLIICDHNFKIEQVIELNTYLSRN